MTRRLLLIAYHYPPEPSAGSIRPSAIVKRLAAHGWTVDLVTRAAPSVVPSGATVVVPHKPWIAWLREDLGIRPDLWFDAPPVEHWAPNVVEPPRRLAGRLYHHFRSVGVHLATFPDRSVGWLAPARAALRDHLRAHPPDAILSTSPPETVHLIARWAARVSGAPWIADLRDPWSDTQLTARPAWRRAMDRRLEQHVLGAATRITVVTEPWAERLRDLHPHVPVTTIRNGFDPDEFPAGGHAGPDRFEILYAGTISPGGHDFVTLLEGARRFVDAGGPGAGRLRLHFLGETSGALRSHVHRLGLDAITTTSSRRPHRESVAAMRSAAANVLFPWQDPAHPGHFAAKLFEYLGSRRPLLVVGREPYSAGELALGTGLARLARTPAEVETRLGELFTAWREGRDAWTADPGAVERHSHLHMVERFADELQLATGRATRIRLAPAR